MTRSDVAVVVIGRNEAARIERALDSTSEWRTIYVDSGSSDGSIGLALANGVETVALDKGEGFSAARGRNAGIDRLLPDPAVTYLQMLDGDCALDAGWLEAGAAALDADPTLGAVFGRLRERAPEASIYSWLCDVEWMTAPGPVDAFGGIVMLRAAALRDSGYYRDDMIAGEEPDLALRMTAHGWRIACLDRPMATHDSGLTRFGHWWRRTLRAGHAFAELAARHRGPAGRNYARSRTRILFWGAAIPAVLIAGLLLGLFDRRWLLLAGGAVLLTVAQFFRMALRGSREHGAKRGLALAWFLTIGKFAELAGLLRYHGGRLSRRRPRLIEYRRP